MGAIRSDSILVRPKGWELALAAVKIFSYLETFSDHSIFKIIFIYSFEVFLDILQFEDQSLYLELSPVCVCWGKGDIK